MVTFTLLLSFFWVIRFTNSQSTLVGYASCYGDYTTRVANPTTYSGLGSFMTGEDFTYGTAMCGDWQAAATGSCYAVTCTSGKSGGMNCVSGGSPKVVKVIDSLGGACGTTADSHIFDLSTKPFGQIGSDGNSCSGLQYVSYQAVACNGASGQGIVTGGIRFGLAPNQADPWCPPWWIDNVGGAGALFSISVSTDNGATWQSYVRNSGNGARWDCASISGSGGKFANKSLSFKLTTCDITKLPQSCVAGETQTFLGVIPSNWCNNGGTNPCPQTSWQISSNFGSSGPAPPPPTTGTTAKPTAAPTSAPSTPTTSAPSGTVTVSCPAAPGTSYSGGSTSNSVAAGSGFPNPFNIPNANGCTFNVPITFSQSGGSRYLVVDLGLTISPYTWYGGGKCLLSAGAKGTATVTVSVSSGPVVSPARLSVWLVDQATLDANPSTAYQSAVTPPGQVFINGSVVSGCLSSSPTTSAPTSTPKATTPKPTVTTVKPNQTTKAPATTPKPTAAPTSTPTSKPPSGGGGTILGTWQKGRSTAYTGIDQGNCGYGTIPTGSFPSGFIAAPNTAFYNNDATCGQCYEVNCTGPWDTTQKNPCLGPSVIIKVTDQCPASTNGQWCSGDMTHFDLSQAAFQKIATLSIGVINMNYRRVSCPYSSAIRVKQTTGVSIWWIKFWLYDVANYGSVQKVELQSSGSTTWYAMNQPDKDGGWALSATGQFTVPLSIRITDSNGVVLVAQSVIDQIADNRITSVTGTTTNYALTGTSAEQVSTPKETFLKSGIYVLIFGLLIIGLAIALFFVLRSRARARGTTISDYVRGSVAPAKHEHEVVNLKPVPMEAVGSTSDLSPGPPSPMAQDQAKDGYVAAPGSPVSPAPQEWEQRTDTTSGQSYYYNNLTGVTQWEAPEGFPQAQSA